LEELRLQSVAEDFLLGEERKWPRIPTSIPALFADNDGEFREEKITNLSRGGCFLKTIFPRDKGEAIEVILFLPGTAHEVTVQGEVMHSVTTGVEEERGMGILFTTVEPNLKRFLANYLYELERTGETGVRSAPRIVTLPCEIDLSGNSGPGTAVLRNLSKNGLFFETRKPLSLFEHLTMSITDPMSGLTLTLSGDVVHLRKLDHKPGFYGVGIRFVDLDENTRELVQSMLRETILTRALLG
jgi:Tfp pilus assembly protein PilZ